MLILLNFTEVVSDFYPIVIALYEGFGRDMLYIELTPCTSVNDRRDNTGGVVNTNTLELYLTSRTSLRRCLCSFDRPSVWSSPHTWLR